jgi:hypothetical protein
MKARGKLQSRGYDKHDRTYNSLTFAKIVKPTVSTLSFNDIYSVSIRRLTIIKRTESSQNFFMLQQ